MAFSDMNAALSDLIVSAVRCSLNQPELRMEVKPGPDRWRIRLLENSRTSEPIDLDAREIAIVKKVGLIPPDRHGDLRIALASIREDWPQSHGAE